MEINYKIVLTGTMDIVITPTNLEKTSKYLNEVLKIRKKYNVDTGESKPMTDDDSNDIENNKKYIQAYEKYQNSMILTGDFDTGGGYDVFLNSKGELYLYGAKGLQGSQDFNLQVINNKTTMATMNLWFYQDYFMNNGIVYARGADGGIWKAEQIEK